MDDLSERVALFDEWAATYDDDVASLDGQYPFAERGRVLDLVVDRVLATRPRVAADLGCGTGTILARIAAARPGIALVGVDFSPAMLARARQKVPQARFIEADVASDGWAAGMPSLDAVVSTYALHELPDDRKVAVIAGLLRDAMGRTGIVVIGDIGFPDEASLAAVRAAEPHWDDDEYPWVAANVLPMLERAGVVARWEQVGRCAGVLSASVPPHGWGGARLLPVSLIRPVQTPVCGESLRWGSAAHRRLNRAGAPSAPRRRRRPPPPTGSSTAGRCR